KIQPSLVLERWRHLDVFSSHPLRHRRTMSHCTHARSGFSDCRGIRSDHRSAREDDVHKNKERRAQMWKLVLLRRNI
ncbi:hypothetical protein ILYODFUR_000519, partial [Ilyodon furcidens]